jgi:hypothetical protein
MDNVELLLSIAYIMAKHEQQCFKQNTKES